MWVATLSNHRFKFIEPFENPITHRQQRVTVTLDSNTASTREKALSFLKQKIKLRYADWTEPKAQSLSLSDLVSRFEKFYQPLVAIHTFLNTQSRLRLIVKELGPDLLCQQVTSQNLNNFLQDLVSRHYESGSVRAYASSLRALFKYAKEQEFIKSSPADHLSVHFRRFKQQTVTSEKYLEDSELRQVLAFMYGESVHYGHFCEFLYLTGLRYGEAAALQAGDIMPDKQGRGIVNVWGTLVYHHGPHKQPHPKSASGRRKVTIPKRAWQICQAEMASHPHTPYIFSQDNGSPLAEGRLNHLLKECQKRYHIDKVLTLHTFRHTHISKLAALGVPLYVIQNHVGHASSKITAQIYLHVTSQAKKLLVAKIDDL